MVEAVETMDGWYSLHDMRSIDWKAWKKATPSEREKAIQEFKQILNSFEQVENEEKGSHAFYQVVGQKADLMLMLLRPTMEELTKIESEINKSAMGDYLIPKYSYVSVIELSKYRPQKDGVDPETLPETQARLKPILPKWSYMSFYPMSRRRQGDENWYTLEKSDRGKLLYEHSLTGRNYAGKVKQFISGSIGFDKMEWGVTLFAHDVLQLKKVVYEMRFDEATSRYGEFDDFYIGIHLTEEKLNELFELE
ncbi:MAG TPA: hydrogen peroxide-dependent heme synthase [Virgibacillus sp.]|nr:hydrogen peroxide-dependent heme synthase [Virgibacillus sp.]HLR68547.1 hydrogen peroxide-dependent heme synthase [Virgibacillus sp.]